MKKLLLLLLILGIIPNVIGLVTISSNQLYVDVNTTYPLILVPLDENIWDINLYTNGNSYNFIWSGTQYELSLVFSDIGDYPFVINSTNVTGEITGTFLVRQPYYLTFKLFKEKAPILPFLTTKYINNFGFITAEFVGDQSNIYKNNYDSTLEKYLTPISMIPEKYKKPVFYGQYINGQSTIKLYDTSTYAFRLIDGQITFPYSYSVPNITKSYGTNIYLGLFTTNGTNQEYTIYVSKSDIKPMTTLFNWILVIGLIITIFVSIAIFFIIPEVPLTSLVFGIISTISLIILRIGVWFLYG